MARPIRTFIDSGVLIAAFSGPLRLSELALQALEDTDRLFLTSPFVRLEVLPKAIFNKQAAEVRFYESFFARAVAAGDFGSIFAMGERVAAEDGIGAMDSLHIAAAYLLDADELITTERPGKSIYRTSLVKVVYLFR